MTPRVLITLAIIVAIGIGTGAMVFGMLEIIDVANESVSAIIATGSMLTTGGFAALIAHMAGAFRDLDQDR